MTASDPQPGSDLSKAPFATTCWSLVHAAGQAPSPESTQALATLCGHYWGPLYAYVRRRGYQVAEAQDLTQGFFAEVLEKNRLQWADETRGRFRSFLLGALQHFLNNEWRNARTWKRGGRTRLLSIDFDAEESRLSVEPTDQWTPERVYERRWATTLLENAMRRLSAEHVDSGKGEAFEQLRGCLAGSELTGAYAKLAEKLGSTEGAIKVAIHRMRKRCRELIRDEIAQTVADPQDIDDELRQLFASLE